MRYLRMLSNSVIAAGVASGYLTTLFLQLNPSVSIDPATLLPLGTVLAVAYGANLTVAFYALIVLRQILAVEMANRESRSAWKDFLVGLKARGLKGVELVVSDDHAGLVAAIGEVIPEAAWQRCYVHFLRNALDHLPRKHGDDCLQELRWLYDRRDLAEAKTDLAAWLAKWSPRYPRLTGWAEENIERTLTFFRLPRQHHKHLKSTNMLERLNEEIRRRTYVVRIFPNAQSCLRLVRALAVETNENWMEANRYINMDDLREHKKLELRQAA